LKFDFIRLGKTVVNSSIKNKKVNKKEPIKHQD
jgi:hypothetical protein